MNTRKDKQKYKWQVYPSILYGSKTWIQNIFKRNIPLKYKYTKIRRVSSLKTMREERENQKKCNHLMFIINFCLNMFRASLCPSSGEQRPCVTAYGVLRWFCWMWLLAVVGRCVVGCEHCEGYCSTNLHSARTPQRSAPQQLTTTSNRTSAVHHMQ